MESRRQFKQRRKFLLAEIKKKQRALRAAEERQRELYQKMRDSGIPEYVMWIVEEMGYIPGDDVEADEFYKLAMQPGFADEMAFDLRHNDPDPERTFSKEGVGEVLDHVHDFVLARVMGQWARSGSAPKHVRITVSMDWNDESDLSLGALPFWRGEQDHGGLTVIDGQRRIPRGLDKLTEG